MAYRSVRDARSALCMGLLAGTMLQSALAADAAPAQKVTLEEVVVTAQKRLERLQDVPAPVSVISADSLLNSNQLRIQDFYTTVPGLNVIADPTGRLNLLIRGIATGGGPPTVAIVVDDISVGASNFPGFSGFVPDIDPSDLSRIEVLRGPQGALYGASSLGGLLKYVTIDPSTEAVSGRLQAGTNTVVNAAHLGYNARAAVNLPISDTLAVRASAFYRDDPGYVDNVFTGAHSVNEVTTGGAHLAALWRPSDALSLKVSALYQDAKGYGSAQVATGPGFSDLQQSVAPGNEWFRNKQQAYSATLTAKLDSLTLTSLTGYSRQHFEDQVYIQSALSIPDDQLVTSFSEELRLASSAGRLEWLVGGYYTNQHNDIGQNYLFLDPAAQRPRPVGDPTGLGGDNTAAVLAPYKEYSAFLNFTYHFTDRFDVLIGGRESRIENSSGEVDTGPAFGGVTITPFQTSKANAFTYLLTPRFKLSDDLMLYARFASGYRPGGPNPNCVLGGVPCSVKPDKTTNYEVGVKGDLNQVLSYSASVYHIDWRDIQLAVCPNHCAFTYNANAGLAKSQGVELSFDAKPLQGLTLSGWINFNDAVLKEGFPAGAGAFGEPGDRLPFSSRFSANFSIDQDFPLSASMTGFAGATVRYLGDRADFFRANATQPRGDVPGYGQVDLRAGARFEPWTANLYATNVTDRRGVVGGAENGVLYIQPRTIGVNFTRTF